MHLILELTVKLIGTIFAAEFVAGMVHWFEDAYIRENTPFLGGLIGRPNIIHHHCPRYMTRHSWWQSPWELILFAGLLLLVAWWLHCLTWEVALFAGLTANANEFHKWSHRTRQENGRVISLLHDLRILQSARHHARHHTDPKNSHYCTITNFLNPVLDGILFWDRLEWLLEKSVKLKRRPDTSVRGMGPAPEWLACLRAKPSGRDQVSDRGRFTSR
jgi:ubiquitin-conjugating enzyme E2 variant